MFCLLPTKCKQQQIAILIISFFLHVNGIRNEGNNMLQQQQQQQQPEQQQQLLHATIENYNYQSSSSSNSVFKPSPIIEFTLADVTMPQHYKPSYEDPQYSLNIQTIMPTADTANNQHEETPKTKANNSNDNRRYSTPYTDNGEAQFLFPNQQQHVYNIPQQQQEHEHGQYQQYPPYHHQQQQQQHIGAEQHLTEMPIYIYKDPYTNENYHYTPTEATILETAPPPTTTTSSHNYNSPNAYKQQQQQQHRPTILEQDNEEYLVHSSMLVGAHAPQRPPSSYLSGDKDVYLKRPGLVYDESYVSHPNAVLDKKRDDPQITKTNKISYDSHDYPPPSYAQQQTSNFLPTPVPDRPPTPRPTQPPPAYASAAPPPTRQDYRPRPPPPPPQQEFAFVRPQQLQQQQQQQQYLQSSQNALPNYANNLDNYLSNKQQGPYYQRERPPPAYLQQQQQQQQPQQQDVGVPPYYESETPPPPSYRPQQSSSYPAYESPQYHHQPPPPPYRPSYNNYYDYQIGEVPPQAPGGGVNYPYPRPPNGPYRPPPPPAPTQQPSGLASLVQYAPQFTSLLLGGGGGGGGSSSNSNSPLGSLLGALTGAATSQQSSSPYNRRPINAQLIRALENIARNDDLQCVPKVLCQMIAGQTQRGQLPSFITSPTITNFLAGFPTMSPALIYGRAALLGLSGGDKSCHQTYVKCPKNEIEIIYYLNNHRGGFFKFFSEPEPQAAQVESQSPSTSLFSILAALTGSEPAQPQTTPRPRPRPPPSNQPQPTSDITGTIGNFFTQLLSDYMGEGATVEYQRRRRRRSADKRVHFEKEADDASYNFDTPIEDYNDEEDSEDTQQNVDFVYEPESENDEDDTQSRVVHRTLPDVNKVLFFPERDYIGESSGKISDDIKSLIQRFNEFNKGRKLKFPTTTDEREYVDVAQDQLREAKELDVMGSYSNQYTNYEPMTFKSVRDSKKVTFLENDKGQKSFQHLYLDELKDLSTSESSHGAAKVVFPEREGKILNRPNYAASYNYNQLQQNARDEEENKFVVPNNQRPQDYDELNSPAEESYNQRPQDYDELTSPEQESYNQRPHSFQKFQPTSASYRPRPQVVHEFNPPVESYKPRPQDFNKFNPPTGSYNQRPQLSSPWPSSIYNSQVTSVNSVNKYVSNAATNNNYYGPNLNQGELKPSKPTNNYFLPTPAPADNIEYDYSNSIDPDENYNPNSQYYSQLNTNNAAYNSQKYTSSDNYNSYRPLRKPTTSSSLTSSGNNNPNRGSYNSYRPQGNPSSSSSSYGTSNTRRPLSSSSYNTNNSVKPQTYPSSNSQSTYDRYHSSLYTTRRPTANTSQSPNKNIYVTNARGETEYYVTPDGRKIYI